MGQGLCIHSQLRLTWRGPSPCKASHLATLSPTLRPSLCLGFPGLEEQENFSLQKARRNIRISIQQPGLLHGLLLRSRRDPKPQRGSIHRKSAQWSMCLSPAFILAT